MSVIVNDEPTQLLGNTEFETRPFAYRISQMHPTLWQRYVVACESEHSRTIERSAEEYEIVNAARWRDMERALTLKEAALERAAEDADLGFDAWANEHETEHNAERSVCR